MRANPTLANESQPAIRPSFRQPHSRALSRLHKHLNTLNAAEPDVGQPCLPHAWRTQNTSICAVDVWIGIELMAG